MLQTLLWDYHFIYQLIEALAHASTALLLYTLLRRLYLDKRAAIGGSLLYAIFPVPHDVMFWSTSLVITIATGLMLALLLLLLRIARDTKLPTYRILALVFLVSFIIPCFYEQPTGVALALPVFFLATKPAWDQWPRFCARACMATIASGSGIFLYAVLKVTTAGAASKGNAQSLVSLSDLPEQLALFAGRILRFADAHLIIVKPSISTALSSLSEPWRLGVAILLLMLSGMWGLWWMYGRESRRRSARIDRDLHMGWFAIFALLLFVTLWIPAAVVREQIVVPRLWYAPAVGIAALFACLIHVAIQARGRFGACLRFALLLAVLAISITSALILIGWQWNYVKRYRADLDQPSQLLATIPLPEHGMVFACLADRFAPTNTGIRIFDHGLVGWTWVPSVANPILHEVYSRPDVSLVPDHPWRQEIVGISQNGFSYPPNFATRHAPDGLVYVPWSKTYPFVIEKNGTITLIGRIYVESLIGKDFVVNLPHVRASAAPGARFDSFVLREWGRNPPTPEGFASIDRWRLLRGSPPREDARVETGNLWDQRLEFVRLDLNTRSPASGAISTRLPAASGPRRAVFRATIPPHLVSALWRTGPQLLTFRLEGRTEPLATLRIDADRIERERRWLPVAFDIPPLSKPTRLIVELTDTEPGGPPLPILLTRGIIEQADR